jgi:hypothetical protein
VLHCLKLFKMCYSVRRLAGPHCTKKHLCFLWGCKDRQII